MGVLNSGLTATLIAVVLAYLLGSISFAIVVSKIVGLADPRSFCIQKTLQDVVHGGELDNPGPQVRQTLLLGAERIGHGLNLISDPDGMLLMRNGPYLVENALVSNRLLEYTNQRSEAWRPVVSS